MCSRPLHAPLFTLLALLIANNAVAQRLPDGVVPIHYDLTFAPDLAAAKFTGDERIRVQLARPSASVVLNAAEIAFGEVTVTAGGSTQRATVTVDEAKEQATLTVPSSLPAGEAEISIKYTGILNDDLRGLYLSHANNRRYAVTQLEATDARRMFPAFDEPALKATFSITAIVDAKDSAISNGSVVADTPGPDAGKHTVKFDMTPKMSTYLVALAVGDFVCNPGEADGIPVRICSTPDKKQLTGLALESTQQIVKYLNNYYSIRYPFTKLDVVAVPDFAAGAMENTAAIFYRETLLLADDSASVDTRKTIASVLAHEIAHQWFGDLVTMQWWDDLWLNEGFATWMQSKPVKAWKPEWHADLDEVQDNQKAMSLDALHSTRPVRTKASTPSEINELFDPIAYEKGAAILRMVEGWVGEEAFRRGVNVYIERYKYGNARAEDFWGTLTQATGKPVDRVMAKFVDQPGVPLVTAEIKCTAAGEAANVLLSQERYLQNTDAAADGHAVWDIPVCLRASSGKTICDILDEPRENIRLDTCPTWVMGNAGARGYYRFAASPEAVRRLSDDIAPLSSPERVALVSDEWSLARSIRHDIGVFLDLASGFRQERTSTVMATLTRPLGTIGDYVAGPPARPKFRAWMSQLLWPALNEIGITPRPQDTDETRSLRATLVAALGETARDGKVLAKARELVLQELDKPRSVDPTLLNVLVPLAALEGNAALYDRYQARAKSAGDPEERYRYLYALASFTDPALVRRTVDFVLGPEVRPQDAKLFVASLLASNDSRDLAWELIRKRWSELQKKTGEFVGNTVIVGALAAFCDATTAKEIRTFFEMNKVPDAERTLRQSLERIASCSQFVTAQRPKLDAWLASRR
jgi:aminopeptidase N